jgi:hypothetical protein
MVAEEPRRVTMLRQFRTFAAPAIRPLLVYSKRRVDAFGE